VLMSDMAGLGTWERLIHYDSHVEDAQGVQIPAGGAAQYDDCEVTLDVPGAGYAIIMASVRCNIGHGVGWDDFAGFSISTDPSELDDGNKQFVEVEGSLPEAWYSRNVVLHTIETIPSAGTYTYYLNGSMISGADTLDVFSGAEMQALFFLDPSVHKE